MSQRAALRGLLLALLLLFMTPFLAIPSASQASQAVIQVRLTASPTEFVIRKSQGDTDFVFTVSFQCKSGTDTYAACTGQVGEQDVQVTFTPTGAPYPDGWLVSGDKPEPTGVKAKGTFSFTVNVKLADDEPAEDVFNVVMQARAKPVTSAPIDLSEPLGQESTASATVDVEKRLTFAEEVTGFARDYMWQFLGAAAVLLLSGVVMVERKRGQGLALSTDSPLQLIRPGHGASYPIRIRNDARSEDRVQLSASDLPPGWTAVLPLTELDLRGGESTQLWVTLKAPSDASPGQDFAVDFKARSSASPRRDAAVPLRVQVSDGEPTKAPAPYRPPERPMSRPEPEFDIELEEEAEAEPEDEPAPKKKTRRRRS